MSQGNPSSRVDGGCGRGSVGSIGSAAGAVGGAVDGHPGRDAVVEAASGSTAGFLRGLRNVAMIRWAGSECRILRGWQGALPGEGKADPDERSGHIGDDVKD